MVMVASSKVKVLCSLMVAASSVTAVCARAAPFMLLPVKKVIAVAHRKTPSTWDVVPNVVAPAICQKMFSALAPPVKVIFAPLAAFKAPAICKIQISLEEP